MKREELFQEAVLIYPVVLDLSLSVCLRSGIHFISLYTPFFSCNYLTFFRDSDGGCIGKNSRISRQSKNLFGYDAFGFSANGGHNIVIRSIIIQSNMRRWRRYSDNRVIRRRDRSCIVPVNIIRFANEFR